MFGCIYAVPWKKYTKMNIFLQLLQNKFDDLKHQIDAGADRINQCNEFAKKLLASESPYVNDIEKSQEQLR